MFKYAAFSWEAAHHQLVSLVCHGQLSSGVGEGNDCSPVIVDLVVAQLVCQTSISQVLICWKREAQERQPHKKTPAM
jgi:hypothetical protein